MKKLRLYLNLTQEEMARQIGVPRSTYQMWEYGWKKPKLKNRIKFHLFLFRKFYGVYLTILLLTLAVILL